jgi:hypothetical protein
MTSREASSEYRRAVSKGPRMREAEADGGRWVGG